MPPSKSRVPLDDSRSEASSTRERLGTVSGVAGSSKGRRVTSSLGALRDSETSGAASVTANVTAGTRSVLGHDGNAGMQWSTLESSILHSYRHAYRLNTSSAFSSPYNQLILSRPGIGRLSPTMARRKDRRRQSKEQLANAVRKHFNGLGIQENEVVVDFLYKVRWQDKNFRMRFAPHRPR